MKKGSLSRLIEDEWIGPIPHAGFHRRSYDRPYSEYKLPESLQLGLATPVQRDTRVAQAMLDGVLVTSKRRVSPRRENPEDIPDVWYQLN